MDCNKKYEILRHSVVCAFANDRFREINQVETDMFPEMMKFLRDMYYNYFKYVEKEKV